MQETIPVATAVFLSGMPQSGIMDQYVASIIIATAERHMVSILHTAGVSLVKRIATHTAAIRARSTIKARIRDFALSTRNPPTMPARYGRDKELFAQYEEPYKQKERV